MQTFFNFLFPCQGAEFVEERLIFLVFLRCSARTSWGWRSRHLASLFAAEKCPSWNNARRTSSWEGAGVGVTTTSNVHVPYVCHISGGGGESVHRTGYERIQANSLFSHYSYYLTEGQL